MTPNLSELMDVRLSKADDANFIFSAWLENFKMSPYAGCVPNNLYTDTYRQTIVDLLLRGAKIWVVCSKEDPDTIVGFVCVETFTNKFGGNPEEPMRVVHFMYTKPAFRKLGVCRMLLAHAGITGMALYTFRVDEPIDRHVRSKGWKWRPYIARIRLNETSKSNAAVGRVRRKRQAAGGNPSAGRNASRPTAPSGVADSSDGSSPVER